MPRYYCDYCKIYLSHDSATGRKQHLRGRQHRDKWKEWYDQYYNEWHKNNPQAHANTTAYGGMGVGVPFNYGMPIQQPIQQDTQQYNQSIPIIPVGPAVGNVIPPIGAPGGFVPPPSFTAPPNFKAPPPSSFQAPPSSSSK